MTKRFIMRLLVSTMVMGQVPQGVIAAPICRVDSYQPFDQEETKILKSIVLKAEANLLMKQYGKIQEARLTKRSDNCLSPLFAKNNKNPKTAFLQNLRKATTTEGRKFSQDPCECSLSLFLLKKELGDQWVDVGTVDQLDEPTLRKNVQSYLKEKNHQKYEKNAEDPKILNTLVTCIRREIDNPDHLALYHGATRETGQFYALMARLHELILLSPTSPSSGLRATDLYFESDFPRRLQDFFEWSKKNTLTDEQKFYTSLGIWGCADGKPLSLFFENHSYSSANLEKIAQESLAFLGIQAAHLLSAFKNYQSDLELGELIQCLIPRKHNIGYISSPRSAGIGGEYSPLSLETKLREEAIQFCRTQEVKLTPASWNTHNPALAQFFGAHDGDPETEEHINHALRWTLVEWLKSREIFLQGALVDYGHTALPPLHQLTKYVMEGEKFAGEPYQVTPSRNALPLLLSTGNIEGTLEYIRLTLQSPETSLSWLKDAFTINQPVFQDITTKSIKQVTRLVIKSLLGVKIIEFFPELFPALEHVETRDIPGSNITLPDSVKTFRGPAHMLPSSPPLNLELLSLNSIESQGIDLSGYQALKELKFLCDEIPQNLVISNKLKTGDVLGTTQITVSPALRELNLSNYSYPFQDVPVKLTIKTPLLQKLNLSSIPLQTLSVPQDLQELCVFSCPGIPLDLSQNRQLKKLTIWDKHAVILPEHRGELAEITLGEAPNQQQASTWTNLEPYVGITFKGTPPPGFSVDSEGKLQLDSVEEKPIS